MINDPPDLTVKSGTSGSSNSAEDGTSQQLKMVEGFAHMTQALSVLEIETPFWLEHLRLTIRLWVKTPQLKNRGFLQTGSVGLWIPLHFAFTS